ncbi:hypothetical protein BCR44DRAFT_1445410 [Catenaria anguillulae PL171]|uniref:BRCT domain-containing protein n=1 Tax=Catenaria anguillulae PL171 TaxID=765915 RepID=A0A1Y2H8C2_9FUNG|nr:hypothetical protein BCR44DRAFT_1445410 [Catenaria anguillulae PL171]
MWFIVAHRYPCHPDRAHAAPLICNKSLDVGRKAGGPLSAHVAGDKSISKFQFELVVAHNDPTDLSLQLDSLPTTPALSHVRSCIRAGRRGATFTLLWVPIVLVVDSAALTQDHLDHIHSGAHMLGLKLAIDRWDAQATHVVCHPDTKLTTLQALAIQLGATPVDPSWVLAIAQNVMPVEMDEPDDITTAIHATFFRVRPSLKVTPGSLTTKPLNKQTIVLDSSLSSSLSDPHRIALDAILTQLGAKSIADASQLPSSPFLTLTATDQDQHTRDLGLGQPFCSLDTLLNAVISGSDIAACFTRPAIDPPSQPQPSSGSFLSSSMSKLPPLTGGFTASLLRSQGGSSIPRSSPFGLTQGGLLSGLTSRTGATAGGMTQGGFLSGNSAKSAGGQSMLFGGSIGAGTSLSAFMASKDRSQPLASSLFSTGPPSSSSATQLPKPIFGSKSQAQGPAATQQKLNPSLLDQIGKAGSLSEVGFHVPKRQAPPPAQPEPDSPLSDLQDTPPAGRLAPLTTTAENDQQEEQGSQGDESGPSQQPEQEELAGEQGEASGLGQEEQSRTQLETDKGSADPAPEPEHPSGSAGASVGGMASVSVVRLMNSTGAASDRGRLGSARASASGDPRNVKPFRKRWPLSPPTSADDLTPQPTRPRITIRLLDPRNANVDAPQPQQDSMGSNSPLKRHATFNSSTISTPSRPERTRFMTLDDDSNSDDDGSAGASIVPPSPRSPPMSVRGSAPPSPQVTRAKRRRRLMDSDDDEQDELLDMSVAEERATSVPDVGSFGQERTVRKRRKLLDSP